MTLPPKPPGLVDVAQLAGVSLSTVSRVLTGNSGNPASRGSPRRTGADAATIMTAGTADLSFGSGQAWGLHVAFSGNHRVLAERAYSGERVLMGGEFLLPGEVDLAPSESYRTPALYALSGEGLDDMAARVHDYLRARPHHPHTPRPVVMNVWEAVYFDHDLDRLCELDLSIYQDGLADLWVGQNGERYGLPKDFDTIAMFYNESMAKTAGFTPEQLSKLDWNPTDGGSFEKLIAAMTVDTAGKHGNEAGFDKSKVATYGFALSGNGLNAADQQTWSSFALSNDWRYGDKTPWTTKWNYGDDKFNETLSWYKSLIDKGYMPSVDIALSEQDPLNGYLAGRYAMVSDGSWMNNSYLGQDKVPTKVAPTAIGPSGARASLFNGLSDGIWKGSKNPDAAWAWVKYLGSTACQDVIADSAVVFPAIKSSTAKTEDAFKKKNWDVSGFTVQVSDHTTSLLPIADHWSEVNDTMTAAIEAYLKGSGDAESLKKANETINALFK